MKNVIKFIVAIGILICCIYPFVYWFNHDALTWMHVFKEMWIYYVGLLILNIVKKALED